MRKCSTMSCFQLEQQIIDFLTDSPRSSIREISDFLDIQYNAVYRVIEGRKGSRSMIGLVNSGVLRALPSIDYVSNRTCWAYELNNS